MSMNTPEQFTMFSQKASSKVKTFEESNKSNAKDVILEKKIVIEEGEPPLISSSAKESSLEQNTLSVSELTQKIKMKLETNYAQISVQGEISNFKRHSSGHWYFSLKDDQAQLTAAMFRKQTQNMKYIPKDGDRVIAKGKISVFPPRGQYQLIAFDLEKTGLGDLLAKLEQLKLELKERGWFDKERKLALPTFPKIIGVITSPTGAAIRDIMNVLSHRLQNFHMRLFPVHVQGELAPKEISQAILAMNHFQLCDVMILARGGGSYEDLMAFNDISVLQAIHDSKIPIISAVGHETDFTLSDFVADCRAPTPSAGAERVMKSYDERAMQIQSLKKHADHLIAMHLQSAKQMLDRAEKHHILKDPSSLLRMHWQKTDELQYKVTASLKHRLQLVKQKLSSYQQQLIAHDPIAKLQRQKQLIQVYERHLLKSASNLLPSYYEKLKYIRQHLHALAPERVLQRGYSIVSDHDGNVLSTCANLKKQQNVKIQFKDGCAEALLTKITPQTENREKI